MVNANDTEWLAEQAALARPAVIADAKANPNTFIPFIMRDEESGAPIEQTEDHEEWHNLINTHDRVILWGHVESGKTQQISIGRGIWEIGNNPRLRIAVISNTGGQASKIVRAVAQHIKGNELVREVFPELRPSNRTGDPWHQTAITVDRPQGPKDPSIQACGMHGNILGARIDLLIMDDVLDYENTRTDYLRNDARQWVYSTLFGRLTPNARVIIIGNAYHPSDLMHYLENQRGWEAARFPVIADNGKSRWPHRWPKERIRKKEIELGPLEFARQMLCKARSDEDTRFKREWLDMCLRRGQGRNLREVYSKAPGSRTYTGVDLAVGKKSSNDLTAIFTLVRHKNGDVELLSLESGRWTAEDIMHRTVRAHRRFNSDVIVESNAAQALLVQIFQRDYPDVPVRPFATTLKRKMDPKYGIEAMAMDFADGKWIIPCGSEITDTAEEVQSWLDELLYYDPRGHAGDRLMAGWFAWEAARKDSGTNSTELIALSSDSDTMLPMDVNGAVNEIWDWIDDLDAGL